MIAIVFPGQGSQRPGMGQELFAAHPEAVAVFDEISEAVGKDIRQLCLESDEETLRHTDNAQIALFTCSVAAWEALRAGLPAETLAKVGAMAGHSIGEYAALVAAGRLSRADGARLVARRGELMANVGKTQPGTMAAVLGLDREPLEAACAEAGGVVVVANDNSPGQLIISGEVEAVKRAGELASAKGAKRVLPLNVRGAFHSPLMSDAAKEMGVALREATFSSASGGPALYSNVTSEPVADFGQMGALLEQQLSSPVRWTESVQHMVRDGVDTIVECGVGEVLCGLVGRIDKSVATLSVQDNASMAKTIGALLQI